MTFRFIGECDGQRVQQHGLDVKAATSEILDRAEHFKAMGFRVKKSTREGLPHIEIAQPKHLGGTTQAKFWIEREGG